MTASLRALVPLASVLLLRVAPLPAQRPPAEPHGFSVQVAPYAGRMWHSLLGEVSGTLSDPRAGGGNLGSLLVQGEVRAEPAVVLGVSLGAAVSRSLAVRLHASRLATSIEVTARTARPDGSAATDFRFDGLGEISRWVADAGLLWQPVRQLGRVRLYGMIGFGVASWRLAGLEDLAPLEPLVGVRVVGIRPVNAMTVAANAAVGADVMVSRSLSLRIELADDITSDPLEVQDFELGPSFRGAGTPRDLVHGLRVAAGIRMDVGG